MRKFFKRVSVWEELHIPKLRRSTIYVLIKIILFSPLLLIDKLSRFVKGGGTIQRRDKPDVVIANILDGFSHLAFPDKEVEKLAHKRANICAQCPFASKTAKYSVVVDNRTKEIQGMACDACGCNLSAKVRSVRDYCPKGKW